MTGSPSLNANLYRCGRRYLNRMVKWLLLLAPEAHNFNGQRRIPEDSLTVFSILLDPSLPVRVVGSSGYTEMVALFAVEPLR
jgi:hypothetical protein